MILRTSIRIRSPFAEVELYEVRPTGRTSLANGRSLLKSFNTLYYFTPEINEKPDTL
jgi:hypothetical protein